ncbi:squamous cell carcinoma antigen recognized by T-cells 3 isoform X1 [Selaginella moellendorffii]|uniref:squamous cell carcinoma antigen recognized by T-cells 3 isoform X1 n=1 Tax=Selaginella moellendorffii TaxID=88036 RepID=UPI000D1CCB89|nr:squamous cell carcinoma antigen recognized by T-cells 3 isoform X1 [Selaginella moellendorffii]|eukprot:XP_024528014.1 squamous cell carcinoma antigen recognized by T-cells 3 isoform X1 [Selaginella moellendorffii]
MADEEMASSSDSESERENGEDELAAVEVALAANPDSYEAHEQYVAALRKAGHLDRLRAAREAMNALFPIPGRMWREWARDEANLLDGSDISPVVELYERGLREYLDVPLWLDYLEFVEDRDPGVSQCTPQGLQKMRELYERAITASGIHATEGSAIWEAYREFEQAVLLTMAEYTDGDKEKEKQAGRVESLFHRQLAVPLSNHASTLNDYIEWEREQGKTIGSLEDKFAGVDANVLAAYKKAESGWLECKVFENSLSGKPADAELLQNYLIYIDFEQKKSKSDPARVQVLFERAVTAFPVSGDLWLKYTGYLDQKLKVAVVCKNVYARAVRNCPWVGELWRKYLLTLERFNSSDEEMSEVFEQSMKRGFQTPSEYLDVFLTRVDGLRRQMASVERLREVFQRAADLLANYFPDFVDRSLRLQGYWARMEVRLAKDISAARSIWERLVKSSGWMTEVWQGYINMELGLENINEVRALYRKCYSRKLEGNGSKVICEAWLQFEREFGTLEDFEKASLKAGQRLEEIQSIEAVQDTKEFKEPKMKHERGNQESSAQAAKRKRPKDVKEEKKRQKVAPKRELGKLHSEAKMATNEGDRDASEREKPNEQGQPPDGRGEAATQFKKNRVFTDELTAFVSNIDLELTEKELKEFFTPCGGLKGVRLLRDRNTRRSRGLAYIDFENEENLAAAISKNRTKLGARKVSVARSKPKPKQEDVSGGSEKVERDKIKPLGWQGSALKSDEALNSNEEFRKTLLKSKEKVVT